MKILNLENREVLVWASSLEDGALEQIKNLARLPMLHKHVAVMPDCHQGYGMPIGGVIALKDAVIPNAVGMDIGCGMCAIQTRYQNEISEEMLYKIVKALGSEIPVGFAKRKQPVHPDHMPPLMSGEETYPVIMGTKEYENAQFQLGTLGSGNHFIELQRDEENYLWIMIHSGSRHMGNAICTFYNKKAEELLRVKEVEFPVELAWFPTESQWAISYVLEMDFALEFARLNRQRMLYGVAHVLNNILPKVSLDMGDVINIHHNYAVQEEHFGEKVWVHRKGATLASALTEGVIPGSMGTNSYIVEGLGNPDSFDSCSHGAGRIMGRNQFNKTHSVKDCDKEMEGIVHSPWGKDRKKRVDLSEAPSAYKNIDEVMENQKDLVKVIHKLRPIAVLKG